MVNQAKAILELFHHEDVTEEISDDIQDDLMPEDKVAAKNAKTHRPPLNFMQMGMNKGDELVWKEDQSITITVFTDRTVLFNGEEKAISAVTRDLKKSKWYIATGSYWLYKDKLLGDIYDETYPIED